MSSLEAALTDANALTALCAVAGALRSSGLLQNRRRNLRVYKASVSGKESVDWMVEQHVVPSRSDGVVLGRILVAQGLMHHVTHKFTFEDSKTLLYQFVDDPLIAANASGMGSSRRSKQIMERKKAHTVLLTADQSFAHSAPPHLPEPAFLLFPVNFSRAESGAVTQAVSEGERGNELLLFDLETSSMQIIAKGGKATRVWSFAEFESFSGGSIETYMRFEFKKSAALEIFATAASDVPQIKTIMTRILRHEGREDDTLPYRRVIFASSVASSSPVPQHSFQVLIPGKLVRFPSLDALANNQRPTRVQPLGGGADVWVEEQSLTVFIQTKAGVRRSFVVDSVEQLMTWKAALLQSILLANKMSQLYSSLCRDAAMGSNAAISEQTVRRVATLNADVAYSFTVVQSQRTKGSAPPVCAVVLISFPRHRIELVHKDKCEEKIAFEFVKSAVAVPGGDGCELSFSFQRPKKDKTLQTWNFRCQTVEDCAIFLSHLKDILVANLRPPQVADIAVGTEPRLLLLNHAQCKLVITKKDKPSHVTFWAPFGGLLKDEHKIVDMPSPNAVMSIPNLTIGVMGHPPLQVTCATESSRKAILDALLSLGKNETIETEEQRIIRKSGYCTIDNIERSGMGEKKRSKRFLVLIRHKLFVFRSARGVWAPRYTLSLHKASVCPRLDTCSVGLKMKNGTTISIECETRENALDWALCLGAERNVNVPVKAEVPSPLDAVNELTREEEEAVRILSNIQQEQAADDASADTFTDTSMTATGIFDGLDTADLLTDDEDAEPPEEDDEDSGCFAMQFFSYQPAQFEGMEGLTDSEDEDEETTKVRQSFEEATFEGLDDDEEEEEEEDQSGGWMESAFDGIDDFIDGMGEEDLDDDEIAFAEQEEAKAETVTVPQSEIVRLDEEGWELHSAVKRAGQESTANNLVIVEPSKTRVVYLLDDNDRLPDDDELLPNGMTKGELRRMKKIDVDKKFNFQNVLQWFQVREDAQAANRDQQQPTRRRVSRYALDETN